MSDIIETDRNNTFIISNDVKSDVITTPEVNNIFTETIISNIVEPDNISEIIESAKQGVPGRDGTGDKHFTYSQNVASDAWLIYHYLNKFPSVTVVDSAGTTVEGDIKMIDENSVLITFSSAFSGKAYFN